MSVHMAAARAPPESADADAFRPPKEQAVIDELRIVHAVLVDDQGFATNAFVCFETWAGPLSTMRKILFFEPTMSRLRNSLKTSELTPPFSLIMNLIWPREVIAEMRLIP